MGILGNISYDNTTGIITLQEPGTYKFDWVVATQTAPIANGVEFSLVSSQGDAIIGNSPIKTGEVLGFGIIEVSVTTTTPVILLGNQLYYGSLQPSKCLDNRRVNSWNKLCSKCTPDQF